MTAVSNSHSSDTGRIELGAKISSDSGVTSASLPPIELVARSQVSGERLSRKQALDLLSDLYGNRPYNVGRFQKAADLPISGSLDQATENKLNQVYQFALGNPEEALKRGYATASAASIPEFKDVVRNKLSQITGADKQSLEGADFTKEIKKFQKSVGLAPDGLVGQNTMRELDRKIAENHQQRVLQGSTNSVSSGNVISTGQQAVENAKKYFNKTISEAGFFDPLVYDLQSNQPNNPQGVLALQGLLKTLGYNKTMQPGVFDVEMGNYIKGVQSQLVSQRILPEYGDLNGYPVQLDPKSGDYGVSPGRVGKDTFQALIQLAEKKRA